LIETATLHVSAPSKVKGVSANGVLITI